MSKSTVFMGLAAVAYAIPIAMDVLGAQPRHPAIQLMFVLIGTIFLVGAGIVHAIEKK